MIRIIITLLSFSCLSLSAMAGNNIQLKNNYPDQYTVVKGDTLWGISGRFLQNPWQWPQVWDMNRSEIKNPHLIYPGDVIVIDTSSGSPRFRLLHETITLQPSAIEEPLNKKAIYTIPPNAIGPFLEKPMLIENGELDTAPRIIAGQDGRVILSPGSRIYLDDVQNPGKTYWNVYRPGEELTDPVTNEVLGTEAIYLGDTRITKYGKPATGEIVSAKEEIFVKDRLVLASDDFQENFIPRSPETAVDGRIIKVYGGVAEAGPESVVAINKGSIDGLEAGHVLAINRHGKTILDPEYKGSKISKKDRLSNEIKLPDERIGLLMIFRTYDRVSYGLIMQAEESVHTLDSVSTP